MRGFRPNWKKLIPFALFHVAALVGAILVPLTPRLILPFLAIYLVRMLGVTVGYHRYFAHRAFKTSRAMQFVLALWANLSLMRGPLAWASHHRYHHKHADHDEDLHSPTRRGFWWSHLGWFLSLEYDETQLFEVRDLEKFPELRFIDRYYFVPAYLFALALGLLGGWPLFVWGFLVNTVVFWHAVFTINSLSHVFGTRRFATDDTSRNNPLLACVTLGEGWHNNHHHYMHSARQGFAWWEIDISYYVIRLLALIGLVWDLRPVKDAELADAVNA